MRREIIWACLLCLRERPHDARLSICRACKADIEERGLCWCNACKRSVPSSAGRRSLCNECRNAKQRIRYAESQEYRAHRLTQGRAWWHANPEYSKRRYARWRLTRPAWYRRAQQTQNERRWRRTQTDPAYREKRNAVFRAYYARKRSA